MDRLGPTYYTLLNFKNYLAIFAHHINKNLTSSPSTIVAFEFFPGVLLEAGLKDAFIYTLIFEQIILTRKACPTYHGPQSEITN